MSYYNQNDDMMPAPRHGHNPRGVGRGRGYQTFENPFGHQREQGAYRGGNGGYRQQNYSKRGNRGGRYQGKWPRGQERGRSYGGRGGSAQTNTELSPAKYVLPEMTANPWEELEKKYEAENAGNNA